MTSSRSNSNLNLEVLFFKLLIFLAIAALLIFAEVFLLSGAHVEIATDVAVRQLEANDFAAESLRLFDAFKNFSLVASAGLMILAALALFAAELRRLGNWLLRSR